MAVKIQSVDKGSSADKQGITAGETLLTLNGNEIVDVLDYRFYQITSRAVLQVRNSAGATRTVQVRKGEYEELGLEFETYLMDKEKSCNNKCIFCFIDQLPKGMRESLYFKDDDSRLSFLFGNYITLTNLTEHEINRIIKMHISPINISVHTTNPELRCKMMNNRFAGSSLEKMYRIAKAGIKINCQIVSCPGINDGDELVRTLTDLEKLYPVVECVAVVPVGLTRYREGLYPLIPYTKDTAAATVDIIEKFGQRCKEQHGQRIVFAGDEFYLKAGREIPGAEFYEDFDQLENGVGMLALMKDEVTYTLNYLSGYEDTEKKVTLACGEGVAPFMTKLLSKIKDKFPKINVNVVPIKNNFFGGGINVSGLVTGVDIIDQLKEIDLGEKLVFPGVMLRSQGDVFLDDTSVDDVEKALGVPCLPVNNNGEELLMTILKD